MGAVDEKLKFAVFFDYDNIEIGVKTTLHRELDVACILEGVNQRGEIVSKIAYGNWLQQPSATRAFTEYGVQMTQRDTTPRGDKNGADINLALDALEMAFTRDHINAFAIISGDSDFMALVNKLKAFNKRVYIVGGKQFTSTILQRNCHEFISYESLMDILPPKGSRRGGRRGGRSTRPPAVQAQPPEKALDLLDRALTALEVRGARPQLGLLKSTMQQLDPAFSERDYGVTSFSTLIEKLEKKGSIRIATIDDHLVVERLAGSGDDDDRDYDDRDAKDDRDGKDDREEEKRSPKKASGRSRGGRKRGSRRKAESKPSPDEAVKLLMEAAADNLQTLEDGLKELAVEDLILAVKSDFDERDYGFKDFLELLELAEDRKLLRAKRNRDDVLIWYPGDEFPRPAEREEEDEEPRRKRAGRRRSMRARAHSADEDQDHDAADEKIEAKSDPEETNSDDDSEDEKPAPKKAARKKAVRKKAVKKTAKKTARKKAVRKAAKKSDD